MRGKKLKRLKFSDWPQMDQFQWEKVFTPVDIFYEGISGAHLSLSSRTTLQCAYSRFLGFLLRHNSQVLALSPPQRVTWGIIFEYVNELNQTCTPLSVASELQHLRLALKLICDSADWTWLHVIQKRVAAKASPQSKKSDFITSEILYGLGIRLMNEALSANGTQPVTKAQAIKYRDGLIIAFLAATPLRRRTLTSLRIGEHLVRSGNQWSLQIPAKDIKTRRPLDFSLTAEISFHINKYLDCFRRRIPGASRHSGLWVSNKSRPMDDGAIYDAVCRRTYVAFGIAINLHQFRHAAGTFWSINDPTNVRGVKDLLGHSSFQTTERNYIRSQSRRAGRILADNINTERSSTQTPRF